MADMHYNAHGGLSVDRESLHQSEGYKRQVRALEKMRKPTMTDLLDDLDEVVRLNATGYLYDHVSRKAWNFVLANHVEIAQAVKDAERWRFFCDECTHGYGDGYTEPEECHAELHWGQGPWIRDGSNGGTGRKDTFPGWNAIIDEAIEKQRIELADLDDDAMQETGR